MCKSFYYLLLTFLCFNYSLSQNPIVPPGIYIADPEAHVWEDGNIYIYGSRDESDDYWCSYNHHILTSDDLKNWTIVEDAFASKGNKDQVDYHNRLLFAPDCAFKNGTYYLYYCSPGKTLTEGVATSKSPLGPFKNGTQIKGAYQIDPAVFIDDDGQGYYLWGQGKPKMAKLKPNLKEIDTTSIIFPLDKQGNVAFHEGSSMRKIGDTYYFIFADDSRNNTPTCLGYATSKHPMGPYTYQGVIIDNMGSDPQVWNNHGSIEKFKGKWYVFYHRPTNNSRKFRKACIEPITINKNGTINEVEMTTQGALGTPIDASKIMQAERACFLNGSLYIKSLANVEVLNEGLTNISSSDYVAYKYLNFKNTLSRFTIKTNNASNEIIEVRLDTPNGKKIAECKLDKQPKKSAYQITSVDIEKTKGEHALYLVFKNAKNSILEIDWFKLE